MTCRDFVDFLSEYYSGDMSAAERAVFDDHLSECPWCRDYLQQYRDSVVLARHTAAEQIVADAPEELIQAVLAARGRAAVY